MKSHALWLAGLALLLSASLMAQSVYRWTDRDGQVHYGHAVPPEYRTQGYERLAPDGRVVERIAPAMTPEQRAEQAARMALQAELQAEQATVAARDRLLLAAYRSERDLLDSMEARLLAMDRQRETLETSHKHAIQRFEDLIGRAAALSRNAQPVPQSLEEAINATQADIRQVRGTLDDMTARRQDIASQYEADLERYRALVAQRR